MTDRTLMTTATRLVTASLACVASLALTASLAFVGVILLAGPHAGLLPSWREVVVLVPGWITVLVPPALAARVVWRASKMPGKKG